MSPGCPLLRQFLLVALLGWVATLCAADELTFLDKHPQLKAQLLQWEAEAPDDVRWYIHILRTAEAVERAYAAVKLGRMGARARGAIPALIETFRDRTYLEKRWGRPELLTDWTAPAQEAEKILGQNGSTRKGS